MSLVLNISPNYISGDFYSNTPNKIAIAPQLPCPQLFPQLEELLECFSCRDTFHRLYYLGRRISRWCLQKYMHMVFQHFHDVYHKLIFLSHMPEGLFHMQVEKTYRG